MSAAPRIDFVVGMSRTGITWLTRALNLHPRLTAFGQSRFWGKHFCAPNDPRGYDELELARIHRRLRGFTWDATLGEGPGCLELGLDELRERIDETWSELRPPVSPVEAFAALAGVFARAGGVDHVIEKTPHHVLHVDRIRAHFPRARFVIIEAQAEDYAAIQRGQPDLHHHPMAVALLFRRYASACERAADRLGADALRVQLRALAEDPDRALDPVFRLLDVEPISIATTMPALADAVPFRDPLPIVDRYWLAQLGGAGSVDGTTPRPSSIELARSLVSLPGWMLGNLRANLDDVEGSLVRYYSRWLGSSRLGPR